MTAPMERPTPWLWRRARSVVPPALVIPGALLLGVTALCHLRRLWRWIRIGALWTNPDNFIQLSAGVGVNLLFGNNVPLRVAALMVWIPSRVADCIDEYEKLEKAYKKWVEAIRGDYPQRPAIKWVRSSERGVISPSDRQFLKEGFAIVRLRGWLVIVRTYKVGKRMFILSMVTVDAAEALSLKKSSCDRAINEFFLDGANAIDRIASKREAVQRKLEKNRPLANKLLKKMGTSYTVDRLINSVSTAMDGVGVADRTIKCATGFCNGMVTDIGKHMALSAFSILGIPHKIPEKWMPGEWEEKVFAQNPTEQYVPTEHLTLPSVGLQGNKEAVRRIEIVVRRGLPRMPRPVTPGSTYRLVPVVA